MMGLQDLVNMRREYEGLRRECVKVRMNEWPELRRNLWSDLDAWLELTTEWGVPRAYRLAHLVVLSYVAVITNAADMHGLVIPHARLALACCNGRESAKVHEGECTQLEKQHDFISALL